MTVEALEDSKLIIWSPQDGRKLYESGFYGKPLGNPRPKEDFNEPLILDPIEGVYLLEKDKINVISTSNKKKVNLKSLINKTKIVLDNFDNKYLVYKDLREKGYVVTPGIKYGCDFAVYEHGPGIDHAPFIIQVKKVSDEITAAEIVKAGRLASTVRKTFIIAVIQNQLVKYLEFKWWRA
ncbi:tRNA-intron lyase [Candidatus Bathyarchaeota archaeon]|nr:tRNA-intron lyase [Candidatus Bathyarchaeota archaeon]